MATSENWREFGNFGDKKWSCCFLLWQLYGCVFPVGIPVWGNLPWEIGKKAGAGPCVGSFAKIGFGKSVGSWSPKTKHQSRFFLACLVFLDIDSCSVNPQVVGSSPTGGAKVRTRKCADFSSV